MTNIINFVFQSPKISINSDYIYIYIYNIIYPIYIYIYIYPIYIYHTDINSISILIISLI